MEGEAVCPAVAMEMIASGEEQVIVVDHRTVLRKVMAALGSTDPPRYVVYDCGSNGWRVLVKLKVITAKFHVGNTTHCVEIEGDTLVKRYEADKNAVMKALKYLIDNHQIRIHDYSSRVARYLEGRSVFGQLNNAMYNLEKLVEKLEEVMKKCEISAVQLAGKESAAKAVTDGTDQGDAIIYEDFHHNMQMVVDMYRPKLSLFSGSVNAIEMERKKYHRAVLDKYHSELAKGEQQVVSLDAKVVLDYVLTYIGAGRATDSNGPNDERSIDGFVQFNIPKEYGLQLCGNVTIKGKSTGSIAAVEDAAFNALMYLEKEFNFKVVDFNYAARVDAEKEQKHLLTHVEKAVSVGVDMKRNWSMINETITGDKQKCMRASSNAYAGPGLQKRKDAYEFCRNCLEQLEGESRNAYNSCAFRFEEIRNISPQIQELKVMLENE